MNEYSPGLAKALIRPGATFTRAEVALLMATAFRWGYTRRTDEEEEMWARATTGFRADQTIRDLERKARREGRSQWWTAPPRPRADGTSACSATP